jgi:beta-lactamase regulating signal transducer with metallopeptidase domain
MGSPVFEQAAHFANQAIPVGATLLLHSTVLLSCGLLCARYLRGRGALNQALVLRGFLLAVLVSPGIVFVSELAGLRTVRVAIPVDYPARPVHLPSEATREFLVLLQALPSESGPESTHILPPGKAPGAVSPLVHHIFSKEAVPASLPGRYSSLTWLYLAVLAIWGGSALFFALRLFCGQARIAWILHRARVAELSLYHLGQGIAGHYRVNLPRMVRSDDVTAPFLTGTVRPVIVLPGQVAVNRGVIIHEMGHLLRGDCTWKMLCRAVLIAIPVQPLIHLYIRAMDRVSEYICDDFVVKHTDDPGGYAEELVSYAERCRSRAQKGIALATTGIGKSELYHRIVRILHVGNTRAVPHRRQLGNVAAGCCLALAAIAVVGVEGRGPELKQAVPPGIIALVESAPESQLAEAPAPVEHNAAGAADFAQESAPAIVAAALMEPSRLPAAELTGSPAPGIVAAAAPESVPALAGLTEDAPTEGGIPPVTEPRTRADAEAAAIQDGTIEEAVAAVIIPEVIPEEMTAEVPVPISSLFSAAPESIEVDLALYTDYESCLLAGIEYFNQQKYFTALPLFKRALRFKPNDAVANYHVGCSYLQTSDLSKAKMFLKIAIAIYPDFDMAYLRLGDAMQREGDLVGAWSQYKLAYDINPTLTDEKKPMIWLDYKVKTF